MSDNKDHLTRAELEAWRDHGAGERARIVGHLALCDACRELAAEVERARPPTAGPVRFDPAQFTAAGYRALQPARGPWRGWLRPQWALTAAALVLVALLPLALNSTRDDPADALRGGQLVLGPPSGDITTLPAFRWDAGFRAGGFIVEVLNAEGAVVYSARATDTSLEPSEEMRARVSTPGTYRWRVTALDHAGSRVMMSDAQVFTLRH